jgi:hypothetical protein
MVELVKHVASVMIGVVMAVFGSVVMLLLVAIVLILLIINMTSVNATKQIDMSDLTKVCMANVYS